jgi:hypothetical protein
VKYRLAYLAAIVLGSTLVLASTDQTTVPEQISLGSLANLYQPVQFDHAAHVESVDDCASCHHQTFGEPEPCSSCHEEVVESSAFVHELHWEVEDCTGCHHRQATGDLRCSSCHPNGVDPSRLEVIGLKGAFHGLCLRCHGEDDADSSCELCHPDRQSVGSRR